jgi:P4 family phage/plasmid primase-like protien
MTTLLSEKIISLCRGFENGISFDDLKTAFKESDPNDIKLIIDALIKKGIIFELPELPLWYKASENRELEQMHKITTRTAMLQTNSPDSEFIEIIKLFLEENPIFYDSKIEIWWIWNPEKYMWEISNDVDILRIFQNKYQITKWIIPSIQTKLIKALEVLAQHKPKELPVKYIQFKNILVNVENMEEIEATPQYFLTNPLPFEIGKSVETPVIDSLFESWVSIENKNLLYEIIAYSLLRDYPLHKIFCLLGVGRNGKSTYLKIIRHFLGKENCTATTLELLKGNFESSKLLNKLVCEVSELDVGIMRETSLLKRLVGQDNMAFEIKNKMPSTFVNYAKIIMLSNTLPTTGDISDGFYSRWIIIDFPNVFDIDKSKDVFNNIPEEEFKNLGLKCIKILNRLLEDRKFTNEGNIQAKKNIFEQKSNLLKAFIDENYEYDVDSYVWKFEFNESFKDFCRTKNVTSWSDKTVNDRLKDLNLETTYKKHRKEDGSEVTWKAILGLKEQEKLSRLSRLSGYDVKKTSYVERLQTMTTSTTSTTDSLKKCERCNCDTKILIEKMIKDFDLDKMILINVCESCAKEL